jgi:hypothetical protein
MREAQVVWESFLVAQGFPPFPVLTYVYLTLRL